MTSEHGAFRRGLGKWAEKGVPHRGWTVTYVDDHEEQTFRCEMCEFALVRFIHHATHPAHPPLLVGCECAGWMTGDMERAKRMDRDAKKTAAVRDRRKRKAIEAKATIAHDCPGWQDVDGAVEAVMTGKGDTFERVMRFALNDDRLRPTAIAWAAEAYPDDEDRVLRWLGYKATPTGARRDDVRLFRRPEGGVKFKREDGRAWVGPFPTMLAAAATVENRRPRGA